LPDAGEGKYSSFAMPICQRVIKFYVLLHEIAFDEVYATLVPYFICRITAKFTLTASFVAL